MKIEKGAQIREGKAKILFETNHPEGHIIQSFKDDATAFDGAKKGSIGSKGSINNTMTEWIFNYLEKQGIPTHFVERLTDRDMLIKSVDIVPIEVVVRNTATGSLCKRLGIEKGLELNPPLVEYFYKSDELHDPLISETHITYFNWATAKELKQMTDYSLEVNRLLSGIFHEIGFRLVDFKLEFGRDKEGTLLLADEFTPDGCRLWDAKTGESMDKDRFRHDLGNVEEAYQEVYSRLEEYFKRQS